jgi:hypothetical protein
MFITFLSYAGFAVFAGGALLISSILCAKPTNEIKGFSVLGLTITAVIFFGWLLFIR